MPYLSLYRKYRPHSFAEIVGQRHVTQTLSNAVKADRIAHAYLFCGPRGTGKTSTARVLAMALNCEKGPTAEPCGECENCRRIILGSALEVIESDAASNRGIDEIRDLRERVALAPADARVKVYIIDEVHMLTGEAFNAFLKTLEEPPAHVVFVLATTEAHRVLPTILSRCQRFDFHRIGLRDMETTTRAIAQKENIQITDKAVTLLAQAADGSVRDAITLLEQAFSYSEETITPEVITEILGGIDFDLLADCADVFIRQDISAALNLVDRVVAEGKDLRQLASGLIGHYRNLLLLRVDRRAEEALALPEEAAARAAEQARALSPEEIVRALDLLGECDRDLRFTTQPRLALELCAVRMCRGGEPARLPVQGPAAAARPAEPAEREARPPARPGVAAPAPAHPQPASQPAPEVVSEGEEPAGLAQIKERWDEVLADLRKARETSVAAFLREATPAGLEEGVLTLRFEHEFHYRQMMRDQKRLQLAAAAVERVFGVKLTLKCQLAAAPPAPGEAGGGQAAQAEPPPRPQDPSGVRPPGEPAQPGVDDLLSMFPGSEIED